MGGGGYLISTSRVNCFHSALPFPFFSVAKYSHSLIFVGKHVDRLGRHIALSIRRSIK